MMIDVSGIELVPGNNGLDCPGNGEHKDKNGNYIDCCCDECEYFLYCYEDYLKDMNNIKL